ncbi:MAG: hypothetical protein IKT44_00405 [Clostridia bacterium]|nr:hypothetical protein [Clostridia bacterium]
MQEMKHCKNMAEMIKAKRQNGIWHFWVFRKSCQISELNFSPVLQFEDPNGLFGIIREVVDVADDCLIGFQLVYEDEDYQVCDGRPIIYYKLSEIRLAYDGIE